MKKTGKNFGMFYLFVFLMVSTLFSNYQQQKAIESSPKTKSIPEQITEAIERGDCAEVKKLLAKGSFQYASLNGMGPNGEIRAAKTFVVDGGQVQKGCEYTLWLSKAIDKGDIRIVRIILQKNAGINEQIGDNQTLLMMAAEKGQTDIVKLFLEYGANIYAKDSHQKTALDYAKENGHTKINKLLQKQQRKRSED